VDLSVIKRIPIGERVSLELKTTFIQRAKPLELHFWQSDL
jgi:hypothetical protein